MTYRDIPVSQAQMICAAFEKDIVVITAWTESDNMIQTTTYGRTARYKPSAAKLGELLCKAAGADLSESIKFEDFRDRTQAEFAEEIERLTGRIKELESQLRNTRPK